MTSPSDSTLGLRGLLELAEPDAAAWLLACLRSDVDPIALGIAAGELLGLTLEELQALLRINRRVLDQLQLEAELPEVHAVRDPADTADGVRSH